MSSSKLQMNKQSADPPSTESPPWLGPVVFLQLLGILVILAGLLIALVG